MEHTSLGRKAGAVLLLLLGSSLAYAFTLVIFVQIWAPNRRLLLPGMVAIVAGFSMWGGIRTWAGWRPALATISLCLAALALFNSRYYLGMCDDPEFASRSQIVEMLIGYSRASLSMGCLLAVAGSGFFVGRFVRRRNDAAPGNIAAGAEVG